MGQKVNPHGLRVGVIKDWDAKWYAEDDFADNLVEDYNIRKFLKNKLYAAGISKIETERASDRLKIVIHTAKPGIVIGKGGAEIENLKKQVEKLTSAKKLSIDIKEVKRPDKDAQLVAENIAQQLENRITYYEKGDRRKRAHHLITRGAAIESVAPLTKVLTETEFYAFAEKAFALLEVKDLLMEAVNEHNKNEFGGD